MTTARTTAEVRKMLETAAGVVANASGDEREAVATAMSGAYGAVKLIALPLAEHRDALAAEVARLREALAASEARAKKAGEGAAWVIARCKEALKLPACARNVRERQALGDVLAYTSAAKGAGR